MTPVVWSSAVEWSIEVKTPGDVVVARAKSREIAQRWGFSSKAQAELAIVVSEASANALVHAGGGTLTVRVVPNSHIELEVVDEGKGIADVTAALRDGVSGTATPDDGTPRRSLGAGLGAIARLSDHLEIQSSASGTSLRARKLFNPPRT
jgi:anti-sigma regulatory factor (Ser/Thr protein kinase)